MENRDEIDLLGMVLFFWERRRLIAKITGAFFILGIVIVLLSRVEYQSSTTLLPESQSSGSMASSLLQRYGGMLGMRGSTGGGEGGLSTGLYPKIIESLPYQVELMNEEVYFSSLDTTLTIHEYFQNEYPPSSLEYIKRYTLGLPGQLRNLFSSDSSGARKVTVVKKIARDSVVSLPGEQAGTAGKLKNRITINHGEEGLLTLTAEFPDPNAAAEVGQAAINILKEYVRDYRTQKAKKELEFAREQVQEAKKRFEEAQNKLAEFMDSNVNLATAKAKTRQQELQSKYDLAFSLYNSLSQNLQQAKLKVEERTPVFTTVEPFRIPGGPSKPNTSLIIIVFTLLGFLIGLGYLLFGQLWKEIRKKAAS